MFSPAPDAIGGTPGESKTPRRLENAAWGLQNAPRAAGRTSPPRRARHHRHPDKRQVHARTEPRLKSPPRAGTTKDTPRDAKRRESPAMRRDDELSAPHRQAAPGRAGPSEGVPGGGVSSRRNRGKTHTFFPAIK